LHNVNEDVRTGMVVTSEIKYYLLSLISEIMWLVLLQEIILLWVLSGMKYI